MQVVRPLAEITESETLEEGGGVRNLSFFGCSSVSRSVVSDSLHPPGLELTRLLCAWISAGRILEWVAISFRGSVNSSPFYQLN